MRVQGHVLQAAVALASLSAASFSTARAQTAVPQSVTAALTPLLGRYNAARHCWSVTAHDSNGPTSGCIEIARADTVQAPDGRRLYLLLTGAGSTDCHACSGLIAFAVFDMNAAPRIIARAPPVRDGGYGAPTDAKRVPLQHLGAGGWGWIEQSGNAGQGYSEEGFIVWLARGSQVVKAGSLPGSRDNNGTECGITPRPAGLDCFDISVSYRVDAADAALAHYPIVLQVGGTKNGRPMKTQASAVFDAAKFEYVAPANLP